MNKNALLDYALYARQELETQIALSLNNLGITKDGVANIRNVGDVYVIDGIQDSVSYRVYELRNRIIEGHLKNATFEDVVEEFAYTWFNRIIAIRFMEVHDYFSHGFRVLTSRDGSYEPEILKNLPFVAAELKLDEERVATYQEQNRLEDLYRYVLVQQCNALKDIIPMLFEEQGAYLELLLPSNLLSQDSIIRRIEDVPEEDFLNDIEIVGWLYQFYNSVKKDEVFASKKKITKETLPAVTQLFTPDWIVRYMAENSIGRIWMESYPNSPMKSEMKYYVDDAEQTEEVQKKIDEIKYKNVKPEDIRIIEPCCGSGHILVYAFDLLNRMYLEKGYEKREIPGLILKNNLYGLDVDKRAAQLAQFALIMKARSIDNRFFNDGRYVLPKVYEIFDSQAIEDDYREHMKTLKFSKESIDTAYYLVKTFKDGKIIGSLLKVEERDYEAFVEELEKVKTGDIPGLFELMFFNYGLDVLKQLAELAVVLSQKYDVMITNPPYCGTSSIADAGKKYAYDEYPNSKADMFAMFMETEFEKQNGFKAMINMHSWMFLASFKKLRESLIHNNCIYTMAHLGTRAFDSIGGEVVQTTTFVIRNSILKRKMSKYCRLVEYGSELEKRDAFIEHKNEFITSTEEFCKIPDQPIAYWVSERIFELYEKEDLFGKFVVTKQGLKSSKDQLFFRYWTEVSLDKIDRSQSSVEQAKKSSKKWFPLNKGGHVKWYGDNYYVVNWENDGYEIKEYAKKLYNSVTRTITSIDYYFKQCISWPQITSTPSFRKIDNGYIFNAAGPSMFVADNQFNYILGLLNTKIVQTLVSALNPTVNLVVTDMLNIPFIISEKNKTEIDMLVESCIGIAKDNWNEQEMSMDFLRNPIVEQYVQQSSLDLSVEDCYKRYETEAKNKMEALRRNEERINELFIDIYGMSKELTPDVQDASITYSILNENDAIKSLISYLIGIVFGRYSLDDGGVIYAANEWIESKYKSFSPDKDGIISLYQYIGINDGLTKIICELIKIIFGEKNYQSNITYISKKLGMKQLESAEEAINRYLNDGFYDDHLKMFQKRPIYWMLSSGKQGAFKCLIYLHRYNKNTLATINAKYFLPRTAMYKAERERLETRLASGQLDAREKKNVETELKNIEKCEEELLEYGQVLDYLANQYIELDLDDGVKENYLKFQRIPLEVNGARVKKDLLVPFGLEKDKK